MYNEILITKKILGTGKVINNGFVAILGENSYSVFALVGGVVGTCQHNREQA